MKEILQNLLHIAVEEKDIPVFWQLPLYLKNGYETELLSIGDIEVLFMKPKEQITVTSLYKHWKRFETLTGFPCVVYGDEYTRYTRERMIELGIPFFFGKDNLYLPFLGVVLRKKQRFLPEIEKFAPITQKMLLLALYEKWQTCSTQKISEKMKVSRATAARCLTELQALNLPLVEMKGKTKYFYYEGNTEELYKMCSDYFQSPIAKIYALTEIPKGISCNGGLTAIARYSLLEDNEYPTFAVTREEFRDLRIGEYQTQPRTERPGCLVQVLRYKIEYSKMIDPVSAILCVPETEKGEARMMGAIEGILEDVFNGNWNRYI